MKTDEIKLLYEYNYWADHRILATCANVNQEQYIAPTSDGSLRAILVHTLDSEWAWRTAFQEYRNKPKLWEHTDLTEADLPTLDALKERWQVEEQAMRVYLASLTDQDLNGLVRYVIPGGIVRQRVLWHCLLHLVNHGTQHRSEAAVLLTSYGQSPGDLDFTLFLNKHFNLPS
jgi:uncharacterized damage-inducible protein DinB